MASPTNRRRRRIIPSTEEFWVFLDFRCANLERLETLLRAHEKRNSFLDRPPDAVLDVTVDAENDATTVVELPGTMIDRYKLVHEIGHGGMGVVHMAVQKEPVKRKVA